MVRESITDELVFDGGVYAKSGPIIACAIHLCGASRDVPRPSVAAGDCKRLAGTWMFGGVLHVQFRHFPLESLGGLWMCERPQDQCVGIVWKGPMRAHRRDRELLEGMQNRSFHSEIFRLLYVTAPDVVWSTPLRVDSLVVPAKFMRDGSGRAIGGHPRLRRGGWGDRPRRRRPSGFMWRAGLANSGRLVLETHTETVPQSAGWFVLRPEAMSLVDQLTCDASADQLISVEGSALNLCDFIGKSGQRLAKTYHAASRQRESRRPARTCLRNRYLGDRGHPGEMLTTRGGEDGVR